MRPYQCDVCEKMYEDEKPKYEITYKGKVFTFRYEVRFILAGEHSDLCKKCTRKLINQWCLENFTEEVA